ncbi:MAG: hypothetical protein J5I94_05465 [Phaeodactylibacter sp.]|nr:hypothetical protein [Phaeodactylibacter sp.]
MIDKFKKAIQDASDVLREQAASLGEGAKEKTYQLIEEWLQVFPKLEIYGLEITSFSLAVALSPALEVELRGQHEKFNKERLDQIIHEVRKSPALTSVFTTIRTTYNLHRRTYANLADPLIVKIRIRLSPEIRVYIGKPIVE